MAYCGDVGDQCSCCGRIIRLDDDGTYACDCTAGDCENCGQDYEEEDA